MKPHTRNITFAPVTMMSMVSQSDSILIARGRGKFVPAPAGWGRGLGLSPRKCDSRGMRFGRATGAGRVPARETAGSLAASPPRLNGHRGPHSFIDSKASTVRAAQKGRQTACISSTAAVPKRQRVESASVVEFFFKPSMSSIEELERDHPVYDRKVPVKVRQTGRDERVAELTIRVVMGVRASHGQRDRLMHIELTDDADLNFLFALDVTEDEFHELKQDQSLLVEFTSFAPKFCELLESCRASAGWF